MHATLPLLAASGFPRLARRAIEVVQVNIGYRCNQSCVHCHVNAGPTRTESMGLETVEDVLAFLRASRAQTLDITGGAPELNPHFRRLVRDARRSGARVIDRCNLTILAEPNQEDLANFLASEGVEVVASLPCYTEALVDRQRGKGVHALSIRGLQRLNEFGYGRSGSGLVLNLVYNPQGPTLPPPQVALEDDYKRVLFEHFGVVFNALYTLANMPIQRFGSMLISKGQFDDYMTLLRGAHRDENLDQVMCRSLVSIDWQGYVYDCDFNQMLGLPLQVRCGVALSKRPGRSAALPDVPNHVGGSQARVHVRDLLAHDLVGNPIAVADHCFGCTAGQGSSCGGAFA